MQLKRPVDLGQPLNSAYGLKYLWVNWCIIGMYPPATKFLLLRILYFTHAVIVNFFIYFSFPITLLANLWFINSSQEVVDNLSVSITFVMGALKQLAIALHRRRLLLLNEFLKHLDERCSHHPKDRMNILNAVHCCHRYYIYLMSSYYFCGWGYAYSGWSNHKQMHNGWFPTLFESSEANFLAAFIYQNVAQSFCIIQNVSSDVYPMCYLTLLIAHLDSLADRIMRIGREDNRRSVEENVEELKMCIIDHKNLLSYFECVRDPIAATMFLQFFTTAFALCLTAINLISFKMDLTRQISAILYVIIIFVQVFPCCWYVNAIMEKSNNLTLAMYSCNWIDQNQKFRKMLIIFMQRSQKDNIIVAGNLAPVTLQTFVAIIRFSFSMFTILIKMYQ